MFAEELEPTNNHSEQQIRHCVIERRITQGTRGEAGQRYHERMWSVIRVDFCPSGTRPDTFRSRNPMVCGDLSWRSNRSRVGGAGHSDLEDFPPLAAPPVFYT
jgi:hypothetical protein